MDEITITRQNALTGGDICSLAIRKLRQAYLQMQEAENALKSMHKLTVFTDWEAVSEDCWLIGDSLPKERIENMRIQLMNIRAKFHAHANTFKEED